MSLKEKVLDLANRDAPAAYCLLRLFEIQGKQGNKWTSREVLSETVDRQAETARRKKFVNHPEFIGGIFV